MKRSGPLKRKTCLRPASKKREEVNKARAVFVREQLSLRRFCEAGSPIGHHLRSMKLVSVSESSMGVTWSRCLGKATELHEPLTRARAPGPETILDPTNSVAVCSVCHRWIHDHPAEATRLGLLRSAHA